MAKKKYEVQGITRDEAEDLLAGQREELPKGSLLEGIWMLVKYSEKATGYTVADMADYFKVDTVTVRSAMTGLNRRGYFVVTVVEGKSKGKTNVAGVIRDAFSSDEAWEVAIGRRFRHFFLPHMQRIAEFGELTAFARPHLLPKVAGFLNEANAEWSDTRKRLARSIKASN